MQEETNNLKYENRKFTKKIRAGIDAGNPKNQDGGAKSRKKKAEGV